MWNNKELVSLSSWVLVISDYHLPALLLKTILIFDTAILKIKQKAKHWWFKTQMRMVQDPRVWYDNQAALTRRREPQPDPRPGEGHAPLPGTRRQTSSCWRSTGPPWEKRMGLNHVESWRKPEHLICRHAAHLNVSLSTSSSSTSNCLFV